MMAVTGIIVIVLVVILAVVGGSGAAKSATVADAVAGKYADQKIQVTGNVVENSYATNDNVLTFAIYDKDGNPAEQLNVRYEGGVSATFGNDVTAICTGKIAGDGVVCQPKVYNGSAEAAFAKALQVQTVAVSNLVTGDSIYVTGTAALTSMTVGASNAAVFTATGIEGPDAGNYSLAANSITSSASITRAPLTITAVANTKNYDGGTSASTASSGLACGQNGTGRWSGP